MIDTSAQKINEIIQNRVYVSDAGLIITLLSCVSIRSKAQFPAKQII